MVKISSQPNLVFTEDYACHETAKFLFSKLKELSSDGVGVTRGSYTNKETQALNLLIDFAKSEGLETRTDLAQNVYFSLPEHIDSEQYVLIGSHIDSVPEGGNYDGAAGIIAGLLCLVRAKREQASFGKPVKIVAIRGEESAWFGHCYIGSKSMLGQISQQELDSPHRDTGRSLSSYMADVGVDIDALKNGDQLITPGNIYEYLELHIEQGPVLVETNRPMAIVSGIRGNLRHKTIHCVGEAGHSGAVPREFRHDSVFAVSNLLMRLDDHWKTLLQHNADLVVTSGIMCTQQHEHAISRIPGDVTFSFEARSECPKILRAVEELLKSEAEVVERERKVSFSFDEEVTSAPAKLDKGIIDKLKSATLISDIEPYTMASGAGHDAAVFANAGIPTGMIFVRNQNGSHNPKEAMEIDDFIIATNILFTYLTQSVK